MRFGRYIVGLPSQDNDTLLVAKHRESVETHDDEEDVNGTDSKDADAIV